jgi:small subunit ribosomal protein S3
MGQKVNPLGLRLGITRTWDSVWYADKAQYSNRLHQDLEIRKLIMPDGVQRTSSTGLSKIIRQNLKNAGVSKVSIERQANKLRVNIIASKPGMIIGKKGEAIDALNKQVKKISGADVSINIVEEKRVEMNAANVAQSISQQLEKRISFRKATKRAVQNAMRMGAKGVKVSVSGRLGGAEIARTEWYKEGCIPLHTFRADIDYSLGRANTTYGVIGVKVWIYKGDKSVR